MRQRHHSAIARVAARLGSIFVWLTILTFAACASSQGRTAVARPAEAPPPSSIQALYESGEDREIVNRVKNTGSGGVSGADRWFAAQSQLRLGLRNDAINDLAALSHTGDPAVQVAAQLAIGRLTNDQSMLDQARTAAAAYPESLFVQYELGLSYAVRSDFASAARIFDACIAAAPTFAYAYYQSALAYQHLDRPDVMANRFDRFLRLAPNAPERPEVDSVLRAIGAGRQ